MDLRDFEKINKNDLSVGLKGLRLLNDLTLEDLSEYTGKDIAYLSRMENGKTSPKMDTITKILAHYNLTIKEFYDQLDRFII